MLDKLSQGIPLAEASAYFIGLRSFDKLADMHNVGSSSYAPPDETGELEGQFESPVEDVLAQMAKMVQNELKTQFAYMVYANSLRDFAHHSIAEEFEDHAKNEIEHADFLLRRMSVLGGPIHIPDIPSPPAATEPADIIRTMIRMEQEGIKNWRILRDLVGDENPMRFKIEEYLTREQEHLDELWQLMPHEPTPEMFERPNSLAVAQDKVAAPVAGTFLGFLGGAQGGGDEGRLGGGIAGSSAGMVAQSALQSGIDALAPHGHYRTAAQLASLPTYYLSGLAAGRGYGKLKDVIMAKESSSGDPVLGGAVLGGTGGAIVGHVARPGIVGPLAGAITGATLGALAGSASRASNGQQPAYSEYAESVEHLPKTAGTRKEKNSQMAGGLPPTAMGQQTMTPSPPPLTGAAAGQHNMPKVAKSSNLGSPLQELTPEQREEVEQHLVNVGKSRALTNVASRLESDRHSRGERAGEVLGRISGAVLGGALGHGYNPQINLMGKPWLQTSNIGTLAGAALGQHVGAKAGKFLGQVNDTAAFNRKFAAAFRKLAQEPLGVIPSAQPDPGGLPEIVPVDTQESQDYLAREQQALEVERQSELAFYKQRFEEASKQLQGLQQQSQQLQQQVDQQNDLQQQTMAQAKQIQDSATKNALFAHQLATQATQQSLQSQQQELQQTQLAVSMRDAAQAMKQSLLQMANQQLPPATLSEAGASTLQDMSAPGQDNSQQPAQEGMEMGQPEAAPNAGTPPQSAVPGGPGAGANPTPGAGAQPTMQGATPQGEVGIQGQQAKVGSVFKSIPKDRALGAALGALVGGGGTYLESRMSNDPLREKVQKLEELERQGAGFANSLNLAQAKARLAIGEFTANNPRAATAIGAAKGALLGATAAPTIHRAFGG
jgi:bacterioferritin